MAAAFQNARRSGLEQRVRSWHRRCQCPLRTSAACGKEEGGDKHAASQDGGGETDADGRLDRALGWHQRAPEALAEAAHVAQVALEQVVEVGDLFVDGLGQQAHRVGGRQF